MHYWTCFERVAVFLIWRGNTHGFGREEGPSQIVQKRLPISQAQTLAAASFYFSDSASVAVQRFPFTNRARQIISAKQHLHQNVAMAIS